MTTDNKPAPSKSAPSKNKNRNANIAAITLMCETYPKAFNRDNVRPLKIGIQEDLLADEKVSKGKIKRALASYVRAPAYYRSIVEGAQRVDLNGEDAGEITAQEAEHAKAMLQKIKDERNARIKEQKQAERERKQNQKNDRMNAKLAQLVNKVSN